MDKRDSLLAFAVAVGLFALWYFVVWPRVSKHFPAPPPPAPRPASQTQPGPPQPAMPLSQPHEPAVASRPEPESEITVAPATQPADEIVLGSLDRPPDREPYYRMQVRLTPRGAGVRQALLTDYFETPAGERHYPVLGDVERSELWPTDMATMEVRLGNQAVALADRDWQVADRSRTESSQSVTFVARLLRNDQPLLDIRKTFVLEKGSFDLEVRYSLVNLLTAPLEVVLSDAGVVMPGHEGTRDDRELVWGHKTKQRATPEVSRVGREQAAKDPDAVKLPQTTAEDGLAWAGVGNKFFAAVIRPVDPRTRTLAFRVHAHGGGPTTARCRIGWTGERLVVLPGEDQPTVLSFANFLGPKDRSMFIDREPYASLNYEKLINYGSCNVCIFGPLVSFMIWLLVKLHMVVRNYGVAIMILVAVVRVLLHPLTKKSQIEMSRMAKLQPKMEELKKQYADNKQELNRAMAEFYRKEGFSPLLGCLPQLLQMPIWVALWGGLNASIELRHAPFFGWITNLAAPDALYQWTTPMNGYVPPLIGGLTGPIYCINLLPILLMAAMLGQQLLTPKTGAGPQAGQQRFMMWFMTIFFGLLFYGMPSGLTLYVMASTAVGVGEQFIIRRHIRQREEAEKRGELPKKKESFLPVLRSRRRRR